MVEKIDRTQRLRDRAVRLSLLGHGSAGFVVNDILILFGELDKAYRKMEFARDAQRDGKWALVDSILTEALEKK